MKMKPFLILTIILSFLSCFYTTTAQSVDTLIQKICVVAREKLHIETATPEERQKLLTAMKDKLKQQSNSLGLGSTAQIRLILQGVMILGIEENYQKLCVNKQTNAQRRIMYQEMQETEKIREEAERALNNAKSSANNQSLVKNESVATANATIIPKQSQNKSTEIIILMSKIESIVNKTVKEDSTIAEKKEVANKLKDQFKSAFQRTYHDDKNKLEMYLRVVEHSIDQALDKLVVTHSRKAQVESALIGQEALAEAPPHMQVPKSPEKVSIINKHEAMQLKEIYANASHSTSTPASLTTSSRFPGITKDYNCKEVLKNTCDNLKQLEKFTCEYDGTTLEMQQMCDGNIDCPDGSDEKHCIQQVIGKIHVATQVMARVEMSQSCFQAVTDSTLLSKQGEVLANILNRQVDFLNKYAQRELYNADPEIKAKQREKKEYHNSINEVAYEVVLIVQTFASTLTSALCYDNEKVQKDIDDYMGANLDKELEEARIRSNTVWLPSSCDCEEQYCVNVSNCGPQCKRFCYQINSLKKFNCQSIKKGQTAIHLDLVCDGKLDCLDETDEQDCSKTGNSMSNSKSNEMFEELKKIVKSKSLTKEYDSIRVEMVELQVCLQNLQKRTIMHKDEIAFLKHTRNKCFDKLAYVLETKLEVPDLSPPELESIYDFLLSVNEKMVLALKQSHFGNKNIISSDDCVCRGTECSLVNCPQRCVRVCSVRPLLTTYNCSSSPTAASVPIDNICNGKINCPNAEDELHCKADICRTHHLKVIRNNVKMLCEKYHGSNIGDVLEKWQTKVTSNLVVLENQARLSPQMFKRAVYQILDDLGLTFGNLEQTRRQDLDNLRIKKFIKISQQIMEMVKECSQ